jgi:hypothetical protein
VIIGIRLDNVGFSIGCQLAGDLLLIDRLCFGLEEIDSYLGHLDSEGFLEEVGFNLCSDNLGIDQHTIAIENNQLGFRHKALLQ